MLRNLISSRIGCNRPLHFDSFRKDEMIVHDKLLEFFKGFTVDSHPMAIMCSVVGALSSFYHNTLDIKDPI